MTQAVNVTRGTVLAAHVERADSFWKRLCGLLGRRSLPDGHALVLDPCSSVHTFFMRFPIDVAFVDAQGTLVHDARSLAPNAATRRIRLAQWALELPAGTLSRTGTERGDQLELRD